MNKKPIIKIYRALQASVFLATLLSFFSFAKSPAPIHHPGLQLILKDTIPEAGSAELQIFESVEVEAYFPGNEKGWRSFLEQNLNPATPVDNGAPAGLYTVIIQFIVGKDGKLYDIKALTKHGYGMEAEVMRILRKSPLWIPAVQDGKNVNAYRKQPVTFQVIEMKTKRGKRRS